MRVVRIINGTTVDGPGFRTSIYFAGCTHHCSDCHNPETWSPQSGEDLSLDCILERIIENDFDVTFSGGDPLYQIGDLLVLAGRIKALGKTIWCYTGYTYEQVCDNAELRPILDVVDVLVDGPFEKENADSELLFRGSSNQRLIDVRHSTRNDVVLWTSEF